MAVLHYAFLKLKMPGPAGVITVNGSFIKSDQCDCDFHEVSDTFGAQQQLEEIAMATNKSIFPLASRSESKEFNRDFSVDSDTVTQPPIKFTQRTRIRRFASTPTSQKNRRLTMRFAEADPRHGPFVSW